MGAAIVESMVVGLNLCLLKVLKGGWFEIEIGIGSGKLRL